MISIVVCSKDVLLYNRLAKNIAETIGTPYQLIRIDNNDKVMSICSAYNQGAANSKYEIICFVHEDVLFKTDNWGARVCNHLKDDAVGAIGIAGASCKLSIPSSWSVTKGYRAAHLIQIYKNKKRTKVINEVPGNATVYQVNSLDGVFIAVKKSVWHLYPFDEGNITGFHGYDMDFSFGISRFTSLQVVSDITIAHHSEGKPNKEWLEAAVFFCKKWQEHLPACVPGITIPQKTKWYLYKEAVKMFYKRLNRFGYSRFQIILKMRRFGVWEEEPEKSLKYIKKLLGRYS